MEQCEWTAEQAEAEERAYRALIAQQTAAIKAAQTAEEREISAVYERLLYG